MPALLAGGYHESTYSLIAAAVWLGMAAWAALARVRRPSAATAALLALAALTTLSALWGPAGPALRAAPLAFLYAGALLVAEQLPRAALLPAVRWACAAVCGLALAAAPVTLEGRLDWPVTYANGLGVVAAIGLVLWAGRRWTATGVCAATLGLTLSRSALLAAALGLVVLLALQGRLPRRTAIAGVAVLAPAAVLLAQPLAARFAAPAPDERDARRLLDVSGHGRAELWSVAWQAGVDDPLAGKGAGTWPREAIGELGTTALPANAHSLPLETFAELGLLGLAALVAFAALALRRARAQPRAAAAVAVWLTAAAADWHWQLPAATLPAVVCAAALARPGPVLREGALVLAAAALVVGGASAAHGIGAALLESGEPRAAARLLPWDARPWVALGDAGRACATDAREPALTRLLSLDRGMPLACTSAMVMP